jgi:hypothetical protein
MFNEFQVSIFIISAKVTCFPINLKNFQVESYAQTAHFSTGHWSFVHSNFLDKNASLELLEVLDLA